MGERIFWDVDTQVDFMRPDGSLYVTGAETIEPNLRRLTEHARAWGIRIVGSVDYHTAADEELSATPDFAATYPHHCLSGTLGQAKVEATAPLRPVWVDSEPLAAEQLERLAADESSDIVFRKQKFDVFTNPNVDPLLALLDPAEVVVYGVALDVCDAYAIDGLLARGRRVTLVEDASKAIDEARGRRMIDAWRARGVRVATTDEIVAGEDRS